MRSLPVSPSRAIGRSGQIVHSDQSRSERIVDVMVDVGDTVGPVDDLSFQRGGAGVVARVVTDAIDDFPGQVEPLAVVLQGRPPGRSARCAESRPAPFPQHVVENTPPGVTEGSVAEIMAERDSLGQCSLRRSARVAVRAMPDTLSV